MELLCLHFIKLLGQTNIYKIILFYNLKLPYQLITWTLYENVNMRGDKSLRKMQTSKYGTLKKVKKI